MKIFFGKFVIKLNGPGASVLLISINNLTADNFSLLPKLCVNVCPLVSLI